MNVLTVLLHRKRQRAYQFVLIKGVIIKGVRVIDI
jgi:hypothetical protein